MMVLIDRKFNEEQVLLEIFFPKMHIERDIRKKANLQIHFRGLKSPLKNQTHVTAITFMTFSQKSVD